MRGPRTIIYLKHILPLHGIITDTIVGTTRIFICEIFSFRFPRQDVIPLVSPAGSFRGKRQSCRRKDALCGWEAKSAAVTPPPPAGPTSKGMLLQIPTAGGGDVLLKHFSNRITLPLAFIIGRSSTGK